MEISLDTYGRVKGLQGTAVVTNFVALFMVPSYPLKSFYQLPPEYVLADGSLPGLPLKRRDWTSIAMAYVRGLFGALFVIGIVGLIFGIVTLLCDGNWQLDEQGRLIRNVLVTSFLTGGLGGFATYWIPNIGSRERRIRTYCGYVCRVCVDPAAIEPEHVWPLQSLFESTLQEVPLAEHPRTLLINLVTARLQLARFPDNLALEAETDRLLQQLDELALAKPPLWKPAV